MGFVVLGFVLFGLAICAVALIVILVIAVVGFIAGIVGVIGIGTGIATNDERAWRAGGIGLVIAAVIFGLFYYLTEIRPPSTW